MKTLPWVALLAAGCTERGSDEPSTFDDEHRGGIQQDDGDDSGPGDSGSEDTSSGGDTSVDDTAGTCEGAAPIALITECTYPGLVEHEAYDEPVPGIRFTVEITDDDGDLDIITLNIYFDTEADGLVDTSSAISVEGAPFTVSGAEACETPAVTVTQTLLLPEGVVEYGVAADWAVMAADAHGTWSALDVITCDVPKEDGSQP